MLLHLLQSFEIATLRCLLRCGFCTFHLLKMINHFGFGYWHLTVWTLLNVLDAVIIVQLERLLRNVLGTKIAERNQSVNNEQMEQKMVRAASYLDSGP